MGLLYQGNPLADLVGQNLARVHKRVRLKAWKANPKKSWFYVADSHDEPLRRVLKLPTFGELDPSTYKDWGAFN
jgi:hypothetical protein